MPGSVRVKLPSYRQHKPIGYAVVTFSGRDVYLGPHGTRLSRENYDRVVGEWLAGGRAAPQAAASPRVTVADLVNAFRKSGEIPNSHAHTYKVVMSVVVRLYRRTPVNEFGPVALKVVRQAMVDLKWKRRNVNNRVHLVRRSFGETWKGSGSSPLRFRGSRPLPGCGTVGPRRPSRCRSKP